MSQQQKDTSRVIRVSLDHYNKFTSLKKALAKKRAKDSITYNEFFEETLNLAEAIIRGRELYAWNGNLFEDVSEAWSRAVESSVAEKSPVEAPTVLIEIGKDDTFKRTEV